jgi:hypothetical protein
MIMDSLEFGLTMGDLDKDCLGFLPLLDGISFLDLVYFLGCLSLLFLDLGSIHENLFSLSDSLLPLVLRIMVPLPLERCEPKTSSCSLIYIEGSRRFRSYLTKTISEKALRNGGSILAKSVS